MPPNIEFSDIIKHKKGKKTVFMPLRNIWRKNFYSNYYAAGNHECVDKVVITCSGFNNDKESSLPIKANVELLNSGKGIARDMVYENIKKSDFVMNVTLSECQPMVLLEASTFNKPCLIGPIQYGNLDNHEYKKVVEVSYPDSIKCIEKHIGTICHLIDKEEINLREMIKDYKNEVTEQSKISYFNLMERK
jgi:hypothetical protein